jgi:hypothetical protein
VNDLPVDIDTDGPAAPPRRNGELVFEEPWQGRAFGLCIALLDREGRTWDDFRPHLVAEIDSDPDRPYFEALVSALERFVASHRLA